jgi:NADPH-dependent glutamate synthase beta subunit-like oxidoreductase
MRKGVSLLSRLDIKTPSRAQTVVDQLYRNVERRIASSPPGLCPIDMALNFLNLCHAQTCGKCVPCRIGLGQLSGMLQEVLDGDADIKILDVIEDTAQTIVDTADCAIGIEAAQLVLMGLHGFRDDYEEHILRHRCLGSLKNPVPCVALCPAGVDIPGYVALVHEGRYADAVRLIRKDNPFPLACAYICEHPCEARCRRRMVDDAVNIRALKRFAVDNAGDVPVPKCAESTGKKIAVIGGGPGGLSAAYYLALMGHKVTVFERRQHLGGMMRYGIPDYRLPRVKLDAEIASILSLGIEVHTGVDVGRDITFAALKNEYDCLYISIGAHTDKKTGIEGEDSKNVISAVELLRGIGDGDMPDFTGKRVVVIGGGNVAMDVTRSAVRLGAAKVTCVYRRRQEDMTAQAEEVEGAIAEGAEVLTLEAPLRIEADAEGRAVALWTQPQIIGEMDSAGRPRPNTASVEQHRIPADLIIVAIGQGIESHGFEQTGIKIQRGGALLAGSDTRLPNLDGVFAGGDCVTGPATVIRAIAAGKAAAANIDDYLGFHHEIVSDVEVPAPRFSDLKPTGRVNTTERDADERKSDFTCIECGLTLEEALQESSRCLRCDHFGYGVFKGGREVKW